MSFATFGAEVDWAAVAKAHNIGPRTKQHLVNVYAALTATVLAAAVGSLVYLSFGIGGAWSLLVGFGLLIWLASVPAQEAEKRMSILAGFGFVQGLSLGPLIDFVIDIDPQIIATAFVGSVVVFGCFSACALFAERRSYLYLGGMLSSALSLLVVLSFLNMFFRSTAFANVSVYFGLMLFSGFIIFDTQLMVERAERGHMDYVSDALQLFLDFVNIFVRILIILAKNRDGNNNKRRRN